MALVWYNGFFGDDTKTENKRKIKQVELYIFKSFCVKMGRKKETSQIISNIFTNITLDKVLMPYNSIYEKTK